jgi:hypothetical protein
MRPALPTALLLLAAALRPSQQQATQRITTCPCDNSQQQQFDYPAPGGTGPVTQGAGDAQQCWVFASDGCDWPAYNSSCIELGACSDSVPVWNVTPGFAAGTVIFQLLDGFPVPSMQPNIACSDWNKGKALLELYPC